MYMAQSIKSVVVGECIQKGRKISMRNCGILEDVIKIGMQKGGIVHTEFSENDNDYYNEWNVIKRYV